MTDEYEDTTFDAPAAETETKTVDAWAEELGETTPVKNPGMHGKVIYSCAHAGAAVLHGWHQFAYNYAKPFECSRADYESALAAAMTTQDGKTVPHGPANAGA